MIDFICAFSGGIAYFALFDFLQHTLGIPHWMATVQLVANNAYGIFGVALFIRSKERTPLFKFLIAMNFAYAFFCFAFVVFLFTSNVPLGTWLLLSEGIFIFLLATLEKRSLQHAANGAT
jgi:hypothetical protein